MKFCKYRFTSGPIRGLICGEPLIATCDRSKPSELTEFKGIEYTKKNPQKMMIYPTAEKQDDLCFWHRKKLIEDNIGKFKEQNSIYDLSAQGGEIFSQTILGSR